MLADKGKLVSILKKQFNRAAGKGRSVLDKSLAYMKEKPEQTALFTLVAANIIKKGKKRK